MSSDRKRQKTLVCLVDDDVMRRVRKSYDGTIVRVGAFKHSSMERGDTQGFKKALQAWIGGFSARIDCLVLSQKHLRMLFDKQTLMNVVLGFVSAGIVGDVGIVVADFDSDINAKGVDFLESHGVSVVHDDNGLFRQIENITGISSKTDDNSDIKPSVFGHRTLVSEDEDPFSDLRDDGTSNTSVVSDAYDEIGKRDGILFQDDTNQEFDDPFDIGQSVDGDDNSVFDGFYDDDDGEEEPDFDVDGIDDEDYGDDGDDDSYEEPSYFDVDDDDDSDPFADIRGGGVSNDTVGTEHDYDADIGDAHDAYDDIDDDAERSSMQIVDPDTQYGGFSGNGTYQDFEKMIPTYDAPQWDYSEINEGIREGKKGLFGLGGKRKTGGKIIGEVDDRMTYSNSQYIADRNAQTGMYNAPNDCKVVLCYSNCGGSGKTTVATMLAAQLAWYFDRDFLMHRTSNVGHRMLVLSLNEFDDILVKGIGNSNAMMKDNSGEDILALKIKIEECGGEPSWDDISHCFKMNAMNGVFYLPSMSLKEKFETGQVITEDDYQKVLIVCKRYFDFVIVDTPDVFYDLRNGMLPFLFKTSDVLCMVMNPDHKSTYHMYNLLNGLRAGNGGKIPLNREQSILVINKVVSGNSPYVGHTNGQQIPFQHIANAFTKVFMKILAIPMSDQMMDENIMFGYDRKVKDAAATLADTVLESIDRHDHTNGM